MKTFRTALTALTAGAIALTLSACGAHTAPLYGARAAYGSQLQTQSVPPQSAFDTITVTVKKILPEDNHGLPHQNFIVTELSKGTTLEVNNDTKYGSKVPNLRVGDKLVIRGVRYHGGHEGIHWTHMANKPGDAGYIKTADGHIYE